MSKNCYNERKDYYDDKKGCPLCHASKDYYDDRKDYYDDKKDYYDDRKDYYDDRKDYYDDRKDYHDKRMPEKDFRELKYIPNPFFIKEVKFKESKKDCCCSDDYYKLLKEFVNNPLLQPGINGGKFAFIGKNLLLGTNLQRFSNWIALGNDNISNPTAFFNGFDNCTCGYINVSNGVLTYPTPIDATSSPAIEQIGLAVDKASLCDLDAIVFDYNRTAKDFLDDFVCLLSYEPVDCEITACDCCCSDAITNRLSGYPGFVNVAAGWLTLYQAEYLGRYGNIAVFLNTSCANSSRLYLVCVDSISFFGPSAG